MFNIKNTINILITIIFMTINHQLRSVNVTALFTGWLINSVFGSWCHHSVLTRSVHPQLWPVARPGQCWAGLLGMTRLVWTHLWCHAHSHTSRGFLLSNQQPEPVVWWSTCCEWPVNEPYMHSEYTHHAFILRYDCVEQLVKVLTAWGN